MVPKTIDYTQIELPQEEENLENIYLEEIETIQTWEQTGHFAASTNSLEKLCNTIQICDKIEFNGKFSDTDKYNYTKLLGKIITFIDTYGNQEKKISEIITDIQINNENGKRRWYANRYNIVFNLWAVQTKTEFSELSTHEMWHITDLGYIQWSSSKKDKNYTEFNKIVFAIDDPSLSFYKVSRNKETIRKSEAKKKDFCSGYGMTDPFEDFSECFNLYVNHNSFFKQIAKTNIALKKKYNFIAETFSGKYIHTNSKDLTLIKTNTTRRPRDTTKL